ncbi:hypothetical protein [Nocardia bovistercoris]|uniref:Tat (Twin-arginine translocation) pathway signal sequence n=1 Tax=Nocardia bovistercoris TaxID=2785916 RepID=A0A931I6B0_9NOCA|nr:hypothetical protein [Nocardia bovistercoris]MBH0775001.1 hypothetical protein [Nocardia bovistercoris]
MTLPFGARTRVTSDPDVDSDDTDRWDVLLRDHFRTHSADEVRDSRVGSRATERPITLPQRPAPSPTRGLGVATAILLTEAIVLALAFVFAPAPAAAARSGMRFTDESDLRAAFRAEFAAYWNSPRSGFPTGLGDIVDYWFHYHITKAVMAALLVIVCATLGIALWRTMAKTRRSRLFSTSAAALLTCCGAFALILTLANIQGATAPFASLLPMLTDTAPDPRLTDTLNQLDQQLAAGDHTPALTVIVADFTRYHLVMAVLAAATAVALCVVGAKFWRVTARSAAGRRGRGLAAFTLLLAAALAVVAVANTTTTADPVPALQDALAGRW